MLLPPLGTERSLARVELIADAVGKDLNRTLEVEVAASYSEMAHRAAGRRVDFLWAPPLVVAALKRRVLGVYKCVREGTTDYASCLVARADSQLTEGALKGRRAGWTDAHSLGGYLLPRHYLRERGADPNTLFANESMLHSYPEVLHAIRTGRVDVGAVNVRHTDGRGLRVTVESYLGPAYHGQFRPIFFTRFVPADAIVVLDSLDVDTANEIGAQLVDKGRRSRFRSALSMAIEVESFVEGEMGEYVGLRDLDR